MSTKKELDELISKLLLEKTFSVDALDAVKQLKLDFDQLLANFETLQTRSKDLESRLFELTLERDKLFARQDELKAFEARLCQDQKLLVARELCIEKTLAKNAVDCANNRIADIKDLVSLVFRNSVIRRTVNSLNSVERGNSGWIEQHPSSKTEEIIEE